MSAPMPRVEFYKRGGGLIDAIRSPVVPRQGEYINISRKQWRIAYVSWAIDNPSGRPAELRANVELEEVPDDEVGPINFEKQQ